MRNMNVKDDYREPKLFQLKHGYLIIVKGENWHQSSLLFMFFISFFRRTTVYVLKFWEIVITVCPGCLNPGLTTLTAVWRWVWT